MKRHHTLKILFLSLIVSTFTSCGLIDKFKTPEEPTDSKAAVSDTTSASNPDDLFAKSMDETAKETSLTAGSDAPANVSNTTDNNNEDLKSLEDEFSGAGPRESQINEVAKTETPKVEETKKEEPAPIKVEEAIPEIKQEVAKSSEDNANSDAGKIMSYKVHKGDTLMLIAFKIYGDPSKWKELKQINSTKLSSNSALRANMQIKYKAPEKNFVWNPEGTPYLIKNGETLGTISNSVYQTPKKWKTIWENNKPLIKNPNVIYAGFTLYYKSAGMANYVQPKAVQKEIARPIAEEIKVEKAIDKTEKIADEKEIDLTREVQSSIVRESGEEVKAEDFADEAIAQP